MKVMKVEREAPSQIVHISKTVKFKGDNRKTSKSNYTLVWLVLIIAMVCLSQMMNNEGTTKIISYKEPLDDKREFNTTNMKPSAKSDDDPSEDSDSPPTETIDLPAAGTDCVKNQEDSTSKCHFIHKL